ncbi:MAG: ABC transporter permease [Candidatus Aenigmarchaeota archaeon]|nr:ABC transporter permease [Candidatus Aenigmarchaeota archaeon]
MKNYDILKFGFNSLTQRKLRSWLTILGIIIGVASMVALISIGEGAQAQVQSRLGGLGADTFTITPGRERAGGGFGGGFGGFGGGGASTIGNLTENDVRVVKTTQGILYVDGIVSGRGSMTYLTESATVSIQGVDTDVWRFMQTTGLASGRYLSPGDTNVVVIGNNIANQMFKQSLTINKQITIEGKTFKVVGILQASGGFGQQDSVIYMSADMARDVLDLNNRNVNSISVKVVDANQVGVIANQTASKLAITRHVQGNKQDFTVSTSQSIQSQLSSVTATLTMFLAAIAGISLLVGAIGISNTMFTSVMERTKQIGILKSLGATNNEIMKIFITEAGLIGFFGGVIGVLFGVAAAGIISELGVRIGFQGAFTAVIDPYLVIFAVLFSIIIGAVSGLLPAKRAANLEPVEALRYE